MSQIQQDNLEIQLREEYCLHMKQCWPQLLRLAMKLLPNQGDAEEVLQEASIVIWKKYGSFQQGTNFPHWAKRVVLFEVMAFRKKKQKQRLQFSNELVEELAFEEVSRSKSIQPIHDALEHCTGKLSEKDYNLVELRYEENQSVREVAQTVKRSTAAIYRSLTRIHLALHGCIKEQLAHQHLSIPKKQAE